MPQAHNEYFIEKEQLPVTVTLVTGEELSGLLFVQPSWRKPSFEYDVLPILSMDAFFPLQLGDGTTRLVAKSQVVFLRGHAAASDDGQDVVGDPARVSVKCTNGESVAGNLMIPRMAPSMRVLDFINRSVDEFILVHGPGHVVLVNRRHVMLVTDESNGPA